MAKKMTTRERRLILIAVAIPLIGTVFYFSQSFKKKYDASVADLNAARTRLSQADTLRETVLDSRAEREAFREIRRTQNSARDLLAHVNQCVTALELQEQVELRTTSSNRYPGADVVRVSAKTVSLQQLVDLLYRVQSENKLVALNSLTYLRPTSNQKGLACEFELRAPST